eukprot:2756500-Rhodomonas_salina.3
MNWSCVRVRERASQLLVPWLLADWDLSDGDRTRLPLGEGRLPVADARLVAEARLPVLETGRDGETGDASVERRRLLMAVGREIMPREINGRPGLPKPALESRSERFEGSSSSSSPSVVLMLRSGEVLGRAPSRCSACPSQKCSEQKRKTGTQVIQGTRDQRCDGASGVDVADGGAYWSEVQGSFGRDRGAVGALALALGGVVHERREHAPRLRVRHPAHAHSQTVRVTDHAPAFWLGSKLGRQAVRAER